MPELIKQFDNARLSKAPAFFDFKKMLWIGNAYIKAMDNASYLKFVKEFVKFDVNQLGQ
jgi:glutamyl/glutaminyl-tRNA synthetase